VTPAPGPERALAGACILICAGMLVMGWALKSQCLEPWDGRQYARLCYNDIQALYGARGVDESVFPYVHGALDGGELTGGAIEYPVLTGLLMWATGLIASDADTYLVVSAIVLAPFAVVASYLLARLARWRALMWAGAPALALYAFHNWDLAAVAAAVAGFWAWHRGRPGWAGALFGVGAAFKLYPLLFLAPLLLEVYTARGAASAGPQDKNGAASVGERLRAAAVPLAACAVVLAAANLPFIVAGPQGWLATWRFHAARGPDFNSIWLWAAPTLETTRLNLLTGGLSVLSFGVAIIFGGRRARAEGAFPFIQVSAAMLAAFLLLGKVHSPQYALWILPFFVLLKVSPLWWAAYAAADALLYAGIFRWFYDVAYRGLDSTIAKQALLAGLWGRAALLTALAVIFSRSTLAVTRRHTPMAAKTWPLSHPSPRVTSGSSVGA